MRALTGNTTEIAATATIVLGVSAATTVSLAMPTRPVTIGTLQLFTCDTRRTDSQPEPMLPMG